MSQLLKNSFGLEPLGAFKNFLELRTLLNRIKTLARLILITDEEGKFVKEGAVINIVKLFFLMFQVVLLIENQRSLFVQVDNFMIGVVNYEVAHIIFVKKFRL
jgi:hypothetical protein